MINQLSPLRRLVEVPLLGEPERTMTVRLRALRRALLPALTAAYAAASPVILVWARAEHGQPVQVLVGGGLASSTAEGPTWTAYPAGAQSVPAEFTPGVWPCWIVCGGRHDPLTVVEDNTADDETAGVLEDLLPYLGQAPFAWLTVCEPVSTQRVDHELDDLHDRTTILLDRQNVSARHAIEAECARERYRELARGTGGVWRVRILAAGTDKDTAAAAATLLCATADLHPVPYLLRPGKTASFAEAIATESITATGELVAAIARPPAREICGVRLVEPARFDLTPETSHGIPLGDILDEGGQPVTTLRIPTATLNRHTFVAGATGAGKSQTVRHLLEQLHHAHIPWLVIEPAKAEYARMTGRIGADRIAVIRPGDPDAIPLGLNPLEPEPGFPLQTHIDLVRALFLAAFEADEPFPQVLAQALNRCYTDLGWNLVLSDSDLGNVTPHYPTLTDLRHTALQVVESIGYSTDITNDMRGVVDVRISSLRQGTSGRFFEGGHPLDIGDLLRRNVVLEIEDIGNDQDKAFFIGTVLIRLYENLRVHHSATRAPSDLRHITVVEEAHRLLKRVTPGTPAAHAVELFTALLAEIRAYGEGLVIAEQIPAKIASDVIKNTALKIIHRLPAADDRDTVGATMNLDPAQSRHVVALPPGRAAVHVDGADRPLLLQVPCGEHLEHTTPPPTGLLRPARARLASCDNVCISGQQCTLRHITHATRLASNNPQLVLWIELITLTCISGQPIPTPRGDWCTELRQQYESRLISCAIAQLAHRAVDVRYNDLVRHYSPEDLAAHVASVARAFLDGNGVPHDEFPYRWQAGPFRWRDVFTALYRCSPTELPHPDTEAWQDRGLRLTGHTIIDQRAELEKIMNSNPSLSLLRGDRDSIAITAAAGQLSHESDPAAQLREATTKFLTNINLDWLDWLGGVLPLRRPSQEEADSMDTYPKGDPPTRPPP